MSAKCPAMIGVKFDEQSIKSIEHINHIHDVTKLGHISLLIGQLLTIFGGNALKTQTASGIRVLDNNLAWKVVSSDVSQTGYSIYQTNWEYFFASFGALEKHAINEIQKLAGLEAMRTSRDPKQYAFWKAIHNGCSKK